MNVSWAISIVLIAVFALIAIGHACCLVRFLVKGTRFSVVPFLGGILGGAGLFLAPNPALRSLWWVPSLLDYGSLPSLISWFFVLLRKGSHRT
jgi:hypothetical protein